MKIEDISVINGPVKQISEEAVLEAELVLGATFPDGYCEYITTFGEGILGGDYVRVYPPEKIVNEYRNFQRRWENYWFWDDGRDVISKKDVLNCIIIADTIDGDEVIFHPLRRHQLFVLPRQSGMLYQTGNDLFALLDWLCTSGILTEPFVDREFEPFLEDVA